MAKNANANSAGSSVPFPTQRADPVPLLARLRGLRLSLTPPRSLALGTRQMNFPPVHHCTYESLCQEHGREGKAKFSLRSEQMASWLSGYSCGVQLRGDNSKADGLASRDHDSTDIGLDSLSHTTSF